MKAYIRLANSLFGVFPPSMKNEDELFNQPRPFWERGSSGRTSCLVRPLGQPFSEFAQVVLSLLASWEFR